MSIKKNFAIILGLMTLSATSAYAANSIIAIGPKISTQGFGLEARAPITSNLYGRLGVNYFHYSYEHDETILNYKIKATLLTVPLMLDYHPIDHSGFRLSAGLAYNGNNMTATARTYNYVSRLDNSVLKTLVMINGTFYSSEELGSVNAKLKLGSRIAGILSLGYDSSLVNQGSWSFNAEAGVMFSGKPKVKVTTTGTAASQTKLIADLNADANKALNSAKNYLNFFPILSIGFKFNL